MSLILGSVTGAALTGLTTPGFVLSADTNPQSNMKAWVTTQITGTQTGVGANTLLYPFGVRFSRPLNVKTPGARNSATGAYLQTPSNTFTLTTLKGMNLLAPFSGQQAAPVMIRTTVTVPVAVGNDLNQLLSAYSLHVGILSGNGNGIIATCQDGYLG